MKKLSYLIAFDEMTKVFDSNLSYSSDDDDDIDDLYHELYDSLVRVKKELKLKTVENESLFEKTKLLEKEIHDLNFLLCNYYLKINHVLSVKF